MKKNIILIDFNSEENKCNDFVKELTKIVSGKWVIIDKVTNNFHGDLLKNTVRFLWYFLFPLQIIFNRYKYNKIIGWQQFYALNFAFFCRLFCLKKVNDVTVMTFIYRRKGGFLGKIYHKYMSFIVTSKYIDRFICFAKEECIYYANIFHVDKSRFVYVPLGIKKTDINTCDDGFVFSTGRSNRNYDFLINVMKKTSYQTIIACDNYKIKNPSNVKILNDCHDQEMVSLMARCHCVVIPLSDLNVSSGQLVILQAMSLGKPVICTKSDGVKDYVTDGVTGIFVNNSYEEWFDALNKLYLDDVFYNRMCACAKNVFNANFTEFTMFKQIAKVIKTDCLYKNKNLNQEV